MDKEGFYLTDIVNDAIKDCSQKDLDLYRDVIKHYMKEFKKAKDHANDESVAWNFQQHANQMLQKSFEDPQSKNISCKKGCFNCCMLNVDCTKEEAILILKHCKEENIEIDWKRLEIQKDYNSQTYFSLKAEDRKCTFLSKDGSCKIYEMRPINCRKLFSMNDPKKCDLDNGKSKILRFVSFPLELLSSALMTVTECDNMPNMLLKYKNL